MPRRGSSKPPAEPVVKPYGCDLGTDHGRVRGGVIACNDHLHYCPEPACFRQGGRQCEVKKVSVISAPL